MVRKFVTGDSKHVVIKRGIVDVKAQCHGCGCDMTIRSNHVGDILCSECSRPASWSLVEGD